MRPVRQLPADFLAMMGGHHQKTPRRIGQPVRAIDHVLERRTLPLDRAILFRSALFSLFFLELREGLGVTR
jgi:hypothetical protein